MYLVGMKNGAASVENRVAGPLKIKNKAYNPAVSLLGIYIPTKELKAES